MKNKKAVQLTLQTIVIAVLVMGLLGFGIYMLVKTGTIGGELTRIAPSSEIICAQKPGVIRSDIDKDGLDDSCDNCVCATGGCKNAEYDFTNPLRPTIKNPRDDTDRDGLPDGCEIIIGKDKKPDYTIAHDATKTEFGTACKETMKKLNIKGRCILS